MKILIIGSNACADMIAQKLLADTRVNHLYHYGAHYSRFPMPCFTPTKLNYEKLYEFTKNLKPGDLDLIILTVNVNQIMPKLIENARKINVPVLSPDFGLPIIEASKIYMKKLLKELDIPTAPSEELSRKELIETFLTRPRPFVVKYESSHRNGLQTIVVTDDNCQEEFQYISDPKNLDFVTRGTEEADELVYLVEQFITGREYSWHALSNGTDWTYLGSARDYKKLWENDIGCNTSGMGAYSPVPDVDSRVDEYADKLVNHFKNIGTPYVGFLYLGILVEEKTGIPYLLEINTRPGSPEFETIMQTIDTNLLDLFYSAATNQPLPEVKFNGRTGLTIRIVNKNYSYESEISQQTVNLPRIWPMQDDIKMYMIQSPKLLYSIVTTSDVTLEAAADKLHKFLEDKFMGEYRYRKDVGYYK